MITYTLQVESAPPRKRMIEPPVQLPPGHVIPLRSNQDLAQLLDQEDIENLNEAYRVR